MYPVWQRLVPVVAVILAMAGCGGRAGPSRDVALTPGERDRATISGAGSTFVAPILQEWIEQYRRVAPGVKVDYRATGSVAGVRQLESDAVDFATSELPLTGPQQARAGGMQGLIQLPWIAGGVAVAYNLPNVSGLKLSGTTLAGVFTGEVVAWNDPLILADNPGVALPAAPITAVHRSDPSGTTQAFAGFLERAAPERWPLGSGATVRWPGGTSAEGSDAVVAALKQKAGSVGYVGYAHARDADVSTASVENGAGRFVAPGVEAINGAVSGGTPESPGAYPISMASYVALPSTVKDPSKHTALCHFVEWVLTEGQRSAERRHYAPLPHELLVSALSEVQQLVRDDAAIGQRPR